MASVRCKALVQIVHERIFMAGGWEGPKWSQTGQRPWTKGHRSNLISPVDTLAMISYMMFIHIGYIRAIIKEIYCKPIKVCDPLSLRNSRVSIYRKYKWTQIQEVANIIYYRRIYECRVFVTSGCVGRWHFQHYVYISGTMHVTEMVHLSYESLYHHEYDYYKYNTLLIKMVTYF